MKKRIAIVSLAIGIGILFTSNLMANKSALFNEVVNMEMSVEKEILVQDWMLGVENTTVSAEQAAELEIRLESWMINTVWNENAEGMTSETEIELEDWMTRSFLEDIIAVAQVVPVM